MRLTFSEIFELCDKAETDEQRIQILQSNYPNYMKIVLKYMFSPEHKFDLPEGIPEDTKESNTDGNVYGLFSEIRRLYIFSKLDRPDLRPIKREMLFLSMYEPMSTKDREVLLAIKDQKPIWESLTLDLVKKAFPELSFIQEVKEEPETFQAEVVTEDTPEIQKTEQVEMDNRQETDVEQVATPKEKKTPKARKTKKSAKATK